MLLTVRRGVYMHGANLPWFNYGGDFGMGLEDGILKHTFRIEQILARMVGMNTLRWWMFPDAWQIQRAASSGLPTTVDPRVYPDLDAALVLAEKYDLYLILVIFNHPEVLPAEWRDTDYGRTRLVSALGGMFKRYKNHPRILAWELGNEWDNRISGAMISPVGAKALIKAFTDKVHATTNTLATTSNGGAVLLHEFVGLGLDYYSAHWYDDIQVRTDDYNLGTHDAGYYAAKYGIDRPLLVGEFYASDASMTAEAKYVHFAQSYAGALGWSAGPMADDKRIDWEAAGAFCFDKEKPGP